MVNFTSKDIPVPVRQFIQDIDKTGVDKVSAVYHPAMDTTSVSFRMQSQAQEVLGSTAELNNDGELEFLQIRMPTYEVEPEKFQPENYEEAKGKAIQDKYEEIGQKIVDVIGKYINLDFRYGIVQDKGIEMRLGHPPAGHRETGTIHLTFDRIYEGGDVTQATAKINKQQALKIISDLNSMWAKEYSDITVSRLNQKTRR